MTESSRISIADLAARSDRDRIVLLDVLTSAEHEAYHAAGAVNACVHEMVFLDRVRELVPDQQAPIVVIGAGGSSLDGDLAADKLQRAGYTAVDVLDGGREAWHAAGRPVEGTAAEPPASPAPPERLAGEWTVDTEASWLRWIGRNPNGYHDGAVAITGGTITAGPGETTGRVSIDPRQLVNFDLEGNDAQAVLIAHLLSDDFLFVERYPNVAFELASVEPWPESALTTVTHRIKGALTMRGVTAPLEFDATVSEIESGKVAVSASFGLDRTRWGMIYGSARFFSHLGMHVVFDELDISLRLVMTRD